jgi:hypothetical protein
LDLPCPQPSANPEQLDISKSTDNGATWAAATVIDNQTSNYHPDKPATIIDTTTSAYQHRGYVAYSRVTSPTMAWPLEIANSSNWSSPVQADAGYDTGSALGVAPTGGNLYVSWWDFNARKIQIAMSSDGGSTFLPSDKHQIWGLTNNQGPTGYTLPSYSGNPIFDNTAMAVDRTGGIYNGEIYVVWNDLIAPPTAAPSLTAATGGTLPTGTGYQVVYTYTRSSGEAGETVPTTACIGAGNCSVNLATGQNAIQTGSLSGISSDVSSVRFYLTTVPSGSGVKTGFVGSTTVLNGTASGILITGGSSNGPAPPNGQMHIFLSRSGNNGLTWSAPARIDGGNANDAWEPTLAVDQSNGRLAITWYDRRDDSTSPNKNYLVYYTYSQDGGNSFLPQQIPISSGPGDPTAGVTQKGTGDYMGLVAANGSAHVIWVDNHQATDMQVFSSLVTDNQPLNNWVQQMPTTAPSPQRYDGAMAYNPNGSIVPFGGGVNNCIPACILNDTWIWDGSTWTKLNPPNPPSPRGGAMMVYDPVTQNDILFGGYGRNSKGQVISFGDTWSWNGSSWTQVASRGPSGRASGAMVFDAATSNIVLFGGEGGNGTTALADTWTWDGTRWSHLGPAHSPSCRILPQSAYDAARAKMVLFGGASSATCASGWSDIGDTWTWDGTDWTPLQPSNPPSARSAGAMAYDYYSSTTILFSGSNNTADTWAWDGTGWARQSPAGSPGTRSHASIAYDSPSSALLLFGGENPNGPWYLDTWSY